MKPPDGLSTFERLAWRIGYWSEGLGLIYGFLAGVTITVIGLKLMGVGV